MENVNRCIAVFLSAKQWTVFWNFFLTQTALIHFTAKQSNEKFDASQLHDRERPKHKTEILPDDATGDVEVQWKH